MLLLAANGDDTDEFAGLVEAMFEIDEPPWVDLGRQVNDCDGLKILLRTRVLDDPDLDGQRAEFPFDIIEHQSPCGRSTEYPRRVPAGLRCQADTR